MEVNGHHYAWPLYPQGKNPHYPLNRRLGRLQTQLGLGGKIISTPLPGIKSHITPSVAQSLY